MSRLVYPLLIALVLLTACANVPVQEMSDARQAIAAAQEVQAGTHAPVLMQRALDRMQAAEEALAKRAWDDARGSAMAAREDAIAARLLVEQAAGRKN